MVDLNKWADFIIKFGAVFGSVLGILKLGKNWLEERDRQQAEKYEAFVTASFANYKKENDEATKEQFDKVNENVSNVDKKVDGVKEDVKSLSAQVKKIETELSPIKKSIKVIFDHLEKTAHTEKIEKAKIDYEDKLMGIKKTEE